MDKRTVHKTEYRLVGVLVLTLIGAVVFTSVDCSSAPKGVVIAFGEFRLGMLNPSDDSQIGWMAFNTGSLGLQPGEDQLGNVG